MFSHVSFSHQAAQVAARQGRRGKSSFPIALICTTSGWISSNSSTNRGPEKEYSVPAGAASASAATESLYKGEAGVPAEGDFSDLQVDLI